MTGTELCHALLIAPLDRKLASCKAADQGPDLDAEKDGIAKAHAQCLEQLDRPLEEGRLALDDEKARACIAAVERAGNAWLGPHAGVLDLAPFRECRGMLAPKQGAGDVCTTALECPARLTCSAQEGTVGQCTTEAGPGCSPQTLSFGIARRNECVGETACRTEARVGLGIRDSSIVRMGETSISGGLPPSVVQSILRQSFGRFRRCYEAALRNDPKLVGEMRVSFTIAADTSVKQVSMKGSTLSDKDAVKCVATQFEALSFPAPGGRPLRVTQTLGFGSAESVRSPSLATAYTPQAVKHAAWAIVGECEHTPIEAPACRAHMDCAVDEFCSMGPSPEEPNRCVARKPAGSACRQSSECKGRCANDTCVSSCGSG